MTSSLPTVAPRWSWTDTYSAAESINARQPRNPSGSAPACSTVNHMDTLGAPKPAGVERQTLRASEGSVAANPAKCALLVLYYGEPPNYFDLWLRSCAKNPDVDWFVIGGLDKSRWQIPQNVTFHPMTIEDLNYRIRTSLDITDSPPLSPIKLCDYRPAFGRIFADLLTEYHYWGHCDVDVIWGQIRKFITDDILSRHDKVLTGGHLSFYRNSARVNSSYLGTTRTNPLPAMEVYSDPRLRAFDEWGPNRNGINAIIPDNGLRLYSETMPYADIKPRHYALRTLREEFGGLDDQESERVLRHRIFTYEDGKLSQVAVGPGGSLSKREEAYIHLQKRPVNCEALEGGPSDSYVILPPGRIQPFPPVLDVDYLRTHAPERRPHLPYLRRRWRDVSAQVAAGELVPLLHRAAKRLGRQR